eukprot:765471-Hanusia_phi.AAC.1
MSLRLFAPCSEAPGRGCRYVDTCHLPPPVEVQHVVKNGPDRPRLQDILGSHAAVQVRLSFERLKSESRDDLHILSKTKRDNDARSGSFLLALLLFVLSHTTPARLSCTRVLGSTRKPKLWEFRADTPLSKEALQGSSACCFPRKSCVPDPVSSPALWCDVCAVYGSILQMGLNDKDIAHIPLEDMIAECHGDRKAAEIKFAC